MSGGLPLAACALMPAACYATVYASVEQAQKLLLPGRTLSSAAVTLTDAQISAIARASGAKPLSPGVRAWRADDGSWFIVDEVVGKHEFITYALALDPHGAVRGIEILDYRETFGDQVRDADWRAQFTGRTSADSLLLGKDIRNVSGATLSCKHITQGIRRLLVTWEQVLAPHA